VNQALTGSPTVASGKVAQPSVAAELLRGNADALDRVHPQFGPALLVLACVLLVLGLWLKRKEKRSRPPRGDDFAEVC
jgi:hypothetical protein